LFAARRRKHRRDRGGSWCWTLSYSCSFCYRCFCSREIKQSLCLKSQPFNQAKRYGIHSYNINFKAHTDHRIEYTSSQKKITVSPGCETQKFVI
jgi:hypothetical protein